MKRLWYSIVLTSLFVSCSANNTHSKSRSIASVQTEDLQKEDVRIQRSASQYNGHFLGSMIAGKRQVYSVSDCRFIYDRGLELSDDGQRKYQYERFILNFMGNNEKSHEKAFDSVVYNQKVFSENEMKWNFEKSFGPVVLQSGPVFENTGAAKAQMMFDRMDGVKASMVFTHSDTYSIQNSAFYVPGEKRDYKVVLEFSEFTAQKTTLSKAIVTASSSHGGQVVEVNCSEFKDSDE
ncbi:MAG: hypothetical protein Fur0010_24020 [Bdellovibrio sp.]